MIFSLSLLAAAPTQSSIDAMLCVYDYTSIMNDMKVYFQIIFFRVKKNQLRSSMGIRESRVGVVCRRAGMWCTMSRRRESTFSRLGRLCVDICLDVTESSFRCSSDDFYVLRSLPLHRRAHFFVNV